MNKQQALLQIVRAWNVNEKPEHRGFRCAACQTYMKQAWHHWLHTGGYTLPVHFCEQCEQDFRAGKISSGKAVLVDKTRFSWYSKGVQSKLKHIVRSWNIRAKPIFKPFTCDDCGKPFTEMYHIWYNNNAWTLAEVHLCKGCAQKTGIE
ncbi:hypothetical protein HY491_01880 [Candidatus Woesearchaeota archaeon]|nr:hypothetical protein [Candidatus Woesearchaeota archaeon]